MSQPTKRRKPDLSEEFKVIVGVTGDQKTFTVAKEFLTKSSAFFRKACNGDWKENHTKTIELPESKPATFSIYLQWLYTGDLIVTDEDVPPRDNKVASQHFERELYGLIIEMYVFADSMMDVPLQNSAMDLLQAASTRAVCLIPGTPAVIEAVKSTMAGSPLRHYLSDFVCSISSAAWFIQSSSTMPVEVLAEVLANFATARRSGTLSRAPKNAPQCHYHTHNDDNPKCE